MLMNKLGRLGILLKSKLKWLIVLAVIIVLVVAVTMANKPNDQATKNKVQGECLDVNAQDKDLCTFISNFKPDKEAYKVEIESKDKSGKTEKSTYQADGRGNSSFSSPDHNFVVHKKNGYILDPTDNSWLQFSGDNAQFPKNNSPLGTLQLSGELGKDKKTIVNRLQKEGSEKCGELDCSKYVLINLDGSKTTQYIWFDMSDFKLRRYLSDTNGEVTNMYISYGGVSIDAPTPIKQQ